MDPKIQIKYVDTKNQLADILTKGNFTRDEWDHLLRLFNISFFSETMSKKMQQGTGEERTVAKSKSTLKLVSHTAASPSTAPSSSASNRPGILRAHSQQDSNLIPQSAGKPAADGSNQNDAASSSQVWLTDAKKNEHARKLAAAGTNQDPSFQERARKLAVENSDINDEDDSKSPQLPHISCLRSTSRENLLDSVTATQSQATRQIGRPRCEYVDMENVYDCHSASRSSSWKRLFGESTFYQKTSHNEQ